MPTRRDLRFADFDAAVRDAEHLLAVGYDKTGKWDLAQVCGHLTAWFGYQLDGYPRSPPLLRPVLWLMRNTVGKGLFRKAIASGKTKDRVPTIPESVPAPGQDEAAAVARFREMVRRWQEHSGPLHPSPLFGSVGRDEWVKGHLLHCAHHLSFLVPRTS